MSQKYEVLDYTGFKILMDGLVDHINKLAELSANHKFTHIYGPPRGGLPMAVHLSHHLNLVLVTENNFHGHDTASMNLLIVDDVSDTGQTLNKITSRLLAMADSTPTLNWTTCCLFFKPKTMFRPDIFSRQVDDDVWIIFPWEDPSKTEIDQYEYEKKSLEGLKIIATRVGEPIPTAQQR